MSETIICVGMPSRDPFVCHASALAMQNCAAVGQQIIDMHLSPCSILDHCFNRYWAEALNCRDTQGATHFAMIHADVCPEHGWASTLLDELTRLDADMVSAVVPLKDWRGLTSTAVYDGIDPWHSRQLSMKEVCNLPDTFGQADVGPLLLNTGLWLCDLRKRWCKDWHFQTHTRIVKRDGRRVAEVLSEDWAFSDFLNGRNAKIYATRKVKLRHVGVTDVFHNATAWGSCDTDDELTDLQRQFRKAAGLLEEAA